MGENGSEERKKKGSARWQRKGRISRRGGIRKIGERIAAVDAKTGKTHAGMLHSTKHGAEKAHEL
jgi:hypothetical protein